MATPEAPIAGDTMRSTDITNLMNGINDLEANAIDWFFDGVYISSERLLCDVVGIYDPSFGEKYLFIKKKPETGRAVLVKQLDLSVLQSWQGSYTPPLRILVDTDQTNIFVTCLWSNKTGEIKILKFNLSGEYVSTITAYLSGGDINEISSIEGMVFCEGWGFDGGRETSGYMPVSIWSSCFGYDSDAERFYNHILCEVNEGTEVYPDLVVSLGLTDGNCEIYDLYGYYGDNRFGSICSFARTCDGRILKCDTASDTYTVDGHTVVDYYYFVSDMTYNPQIPYDHRDSVPPESRTYYSSDADKRIIDVKKTGETEAYKIVGGGYETVWLLNTIDGQGYPGDGGEWSIDVHDRSSGTKKFTLNVGQFKAIPTHDGDYDISASIVPGWQWFGGYYKFVSRSSTNVSIWAVHWDSSAHEYFVSRFGGVFEVPGSAMETEEYKSYSHVIIAYIRVDFLLDGGFVPSYTHKYKAYFDADTGDLLGYVELPISGDGTLTDWYGYRWNEAGISLGDPPVADEALTFANGATPPYTTVAHPSGCNPVISHIVDLRTAIEGVCYKYRDDSYEFLTLPAILEAIHPGTDTWLRSTDDMVALGICDVTDIQELYDVVHLLEESLPL